MTMSTYFILIISMVIAAAMVLQGESTAKNDETTTTTTQSQLRRLTIVHPNYDPCTARTGCVHDSDCMEDNDRYNDIVCVCNRHYTEGRKFVPSLPIDACFDFELNYPGYGVDLSSVVPENDEEEAVVPSEESI